MDKCERMINPSNQKETDTSEEVDNCEKMKNLSKRRDTCQKVHNCVRMKNPSNKEETHIPEFTKRELQTAIDCLKKGKIRRLETPKG